MIRYELPSSSGAAGSLLKYDLYFDSLDPSGANSLVITPPATTNGIIPIGFITYTNFVNPNPVAYWFEIDNVKCTDNTPYAGGNSYIYIPLSPFSSNYGAPYTGYGLNTALSLPSIVCKLTVTNPDPSDFIWIQIWYFEFTKPF